MNEFNWSYTEIIQSIRMDNDDIHKTGVLNMFLKDHIRWYPYPYQMISIKQVYWICFQKDPVRDREFHPWQETCFKLIRHLNGSELKTNLHRTKMQKLLWHKRVENHTNNIVGNRDVNHINNNNNNPSIQICNRCQQERIISTFGWFVFFIFYPQMIWDFC